jgi:hypothetical protein
MEIETPDGRVIEGFQQKADGVGTRTQTQEQNKGAVTVRFTIASGHPVIMIY